MPVTKYQVTDKNGKVHKRSTESRTYTHCIVRHWEAYSYQDGNGRTHQVAGGSTSYGWAGRPDLAKKLAAAAWKREHTIDVEILEVKKAATKLTALELKVLITLYKSSEGNGHDFGFTEDAEKCVDRPRQLGGVIASLVKKNLITVYDPVTTDTGTWHQFTFNDVEQIEEYRRTGTLEVRS